MDSSLWFDTMILVNPFVNIFGCQVLIFKKCYIILSGDLLTLANSVDPNEMQHYAAFYLGLYCLQKYSFMGFLKTKCLKV